MKYRKYSDENTFLEVWGEWYLNVQRMENGIGVFWGIKMWRIALYVRWNGKRHDPEYKREYPRNIRGIDLKPQK